MIFIIPIILGALALGTAVAGAVSGIDGMSNMQEAEEIGKDAQNRHEEAVNSIQKEWQTTQELAESYGQLQIDIKVDTIGRFVKFLETINRRGSQENQDYLKELEGISVQQIREYKTTALEAEQFAIGGVKAVGAAAAAGQGTLAAVGLFGTASTGAAISGLSGAAAWNATLAWLGGGALAAGGGGMALGTLVLGGITVGPALAVGGFILASQGEKALTKAIEYEAKVNTEIAKLDAAQDVLNNIQCRINELGDLALDLDERATGLLNRLESKPFNPKENASQFQQVALLIKALSEILKTPILDSQGNLNPVTSTIRAKYAKLANS